MNLNTNRCLVTGAAGFIGSHLAYKLMDMGVSVICIDNFNSYYDPVLKRARKTRLDQLSSNLGLNSSKYTFEEIDICDQKAIDSLFETYRPETVCHLAAQAGVRYSLEHPHSYVDSNISGTINLLEAAKNYETSDFVFASTSSVYGLNSNMPFKEEASIDSTISTYSATKRACELLCHTYHNIYDIRFRILRFFTVYGPWGRPDMALFLFTKSILNDESINVYNEGNMKRDFTYVSDIVEGFTSAVFEKHDFEIFNLGSGNTVNLNEFIEHGEDKIGKTAKKVLMPLQPGDVQSTWSDISKAQKMLNYEPKVDIKTGVSHFVNWYLDFYDD